MLIVHDQCYNNDMFLVEMISWWYGDGWKCRLLMGINRIKSSADFFSIKQMIVTLFEPFRQISASKKDGSINVIVQSFFDRLVSRFVGFFMRMTMIIAGVVTILSQVIYGCIIVFVWALVPLFPFVGLIFSILRLSF